MRKNKKALTIIAVVLGLLVLYCLMNHSEGFLTADEQDAKDAADLRALQNAKLQDPAYRALLAKANSPFITSPNYTAAQAANMQAQAAQAAKNQAAYYGNNVKPAAQVNSTPAPVKITLPAGLKIRTAANGGAQIQR